jgi:hypothetical protein
MIFNAAFSQGDVEYAVTDGILVDGTYPDTTTTIIKFVHDGLDLYISLNSNDKYVNKWGGSWEGDGLFMKVLAADNSWIEYKLFWNKAGVDTNNSVQIAYESNGPEGSGEGVAHKNPGTIVNDTTAVDSGYTAELLIHLDMLGYTDPYADIPVLMNIFDPDGQTGAAGEEYTVGSYHKLWWGSEWGPETRILRLADPPVKNAITTGDDVITLDGQLTESFWEKAESVVIAKNSNSSTGGYYMQWGQEENEYTDQSEAVVKFAHKGTDLYVGVVSNDSSVCAYWPGWEGDGLFLFVTYYHDIPAAADRMEIKTLYTEQVESASAVFAMSANVPTGLAEGVSYEFPGTVTHTETNGPDAGYSAEVVIHTDLLGYSDGDTVAIAATVWDLDYASSDAYTDGVADYAPNWWGTQWADLSFEKYNLYRGVVLSSLTTDVENETGLVHAEDFSLSQNYPNPFNPSTTISYRLPVDANVKIEVFNVMGEKVATLIDGKYAAGNHHVEWHGMDNTGNSVGSGVYFYRLSANDYTHTQKMILMK